MVCTYTLPDRHLYIGKEFLVKEQPDNTYGVAKGCQLRYRRGTELWYANTLTPSKHVWNKAFGYFSCTEGELKTLRQLSSYTVRILGIGDPR